MLSGRTGILRSRPERRGAGGTAGGGGRCFLGAGGCLTGVGATGGVMGPGSGDEGRDGGGESSTSGIGASMGGSAGISAGTRCDRFMGLSHLGNCASENSACAAVKRTLLGERMNKKLASLPGATPRYTISSDFGASLFVRTSGGRKTYAAQPKTRKWSIRGCLL